MDLNTIYFTLLLSGFVLIGMEIFIPGGLLGIIGALIWIAASFVGWNEFVYPFNLISSIGLILILILTFYIWMKFFPHSKVGKGLTLTDNVNDSSPHYVHDIAIGQKGIAATTLRPAGIAIFNEQRVDVVTDASWIEENSDIEIIEIKKRQIIVKKI